MNGWSKLAAFVAVAAIVAGLSGGAGATSSPASAAKAGSNAATHRAASGQADLLRHANLHTIAGVRQYLRAIGVNPRGVVVQRGVRNYAGPNCPGAGWTCTSTAHPVVQIAAAGGKNTFLCKTGNCAVVQTTISAAAKTSRALTAAAAVPNTAKCVKTTGLTQSCSINQVNTTADNTAGVYENTSKMSGLTQTASYTASITQSATTGMNFACVYQEVSIDGSTTALKGKPVTVTLRAHQGITIAQNSLTGNTAANAADSSGGCPRVPDPAKPLTQKQTLTSTAYGNAAITQLENDPADPTSGPNLNLAINQNQSDTYKGIAGGTNTITTLQQSNQVADASGGSTGSNLQTDGPVVQTQSKPPDGGILATMNQSSTAKSTISATQVENQCELAQKTGSLPTGGPLPTDAGGCFTVSRPGPLPAQLSQTQYGPIASGGHTRNTARRSLAKNGKDSSVQGDNPDDTFGVSQVTTQKKDLNDPSSQPNVMTVTCTTSGNCSGTSALHNNNNPNLQNGNAGTGNVTFDTNCTSNCQTTANFPRGNILVSVGSGKVQMWNSTGTTLLHTFDTGTTSFTTGLAFDSARNLYVTDFGANDVSKFNSDGSLAGSFGSGYNHSPESIVFDGSGNAFVGQADGSHEVLKFSPTGTPITSFAPTIENRGTDWIDLASDGCTLYYTSEGTSVRRFDVCANAQLTDFATGLPGTDAFAIKLLPGGGALVADTSSIVRLDASGNVVQQYGTGGSGAWFSLALDPSGTSFWAGKSNTGDVQKFDLASGNVLAGFNTGLTPPDVADGIAIAP
jgi:hypothetical protein